MQEACEATQGGMAAIIGGEEQQVRDLAAAADVDVANLNSPGQIVLSGEQSKIALAVGMAKEYGARKAVELTVAGAFHSRLMEPAYQRLSAVLAETEIRTPAVTVISNIDALPADPRCDPQSAGRSGDRVRSGGPEASSISSTMSASPASSNSGPAASSPASSAASAREPRSSASPTPPRSRRRSLCSPDHDSPVRLRHAGGPSGSSSASWR